MYCVQFWLEKQCECPQSRSESAQSIGKIIFCCTSVSPGEMSSLGSEGCSAAQEGWGCFHCSEWSWRSKCRIGLLFAWCNKTQDEVLSTGKHHQHFSNCFSPIFQPEMIRKKSLAKYFQEKKEQNLSVRAFPIVSLWVLLL